MLLNYLVIACRTLYRNKVFSFINIAGLSLGIAAYVLLFKYIAFELSYDNFHKHAENIYRIRHDCYKQGVIESSSAISYYGAAPAIKQSFAEVESFVRLHRADGMMSHYKRDGTLVSYNEKKSFYADTSFFSVFDFPLVKGERAHVLRKNNSMLMSASAATKYFGNEDPIGKIITLSTEWQGGDYIVEGIFEDIPENSHVKFDFLFAIEKLLVNPQFKDRGWWWTNFYTYLLLKDGTDPQAFESKLTQIIDANLGEDLRKLNNEERFILQPLNAIHLNSAIDAEVEVNSDRKTISFLSIISFFIIGIAWLNYINLSTAKATERSREVGIRKVLGSGKRQLVKQFLTESVLMSLVAVLLAGLIILIADPFFDRFTGKETAFNFTMYPQRWIVALSVLLLGTFLSGLYPAFVQSSFKPIAVLKGKWVTKVKGVRIRHAMVVLQFTASIILIIGTITIYRQLEFMRAQDLGMNINQKVVISAPKVVKSESYHNTVNIFKNELLNQTGISHVTVSSEVPGKEIFWTNEFRMASDPETTRKLMNILAVDEDFIPSFDMQLLAGRNFESDRQNDYSESVIINESAMKRLGITDPEKALGEQMAVGVRSKKIIGVVKDFHQQSLKRRPGPTVLYNIPWVKDYITLTVPQDAIVDRIATVQKIYQQVFPENAFEYFFLNERFNEQYKAEERFREIFILFSVLSIFVACIGLFGLSSFIILQRTKEIGVRKVLGASVSGIAVLLSRDFIKPIVIAFIIAIPIASYCMNEWLQEFAFRTTVPYWIYACAGIITFGVAIFTLSAQAIRAASLNPIEAIRTE
jgi:putative ABC transport system permease protein